jgi:site-specific DNA recombinase
MKAAIYTRVSTDMQIDGYSLDAQLSACKAVAQAKGCAEIIEFSDQGKSGRSTKRPQLQAMLSAARAGRFDLLVFHKLDRLGRNARDLFNTFAELEAAGVEICTAQENYDRKTPIGKMTFAMQAAMAEWYSDNLATETKKGKHARARAGQWSGGDCPFGYVASFKKDNGDGLARPHPTDAEAVKLAFEKYATGNYSDYDIADMLNRAGYRPKGRGSRAQPLFTKDTVTCLLKNCFYLGEVHYHGEIFPGLHEPIISRELFDRVQAVRRERRSNTGTHARKDSRIFILAGLAYCNRCKTKMRGSSAKGYRYYKDPARDHMIKCDQLLIRADRAEAAIGDYLRGLELPGDWRERVLRRLQTETGRADEIRKEHAAIMGQIERLKKLFLWGHISEKEYATEKRQLEYGLSGLIPPVLPDLERAAALLGDFGRLWDAAKPEERKQIAQALIESVYLDNGPGGPVVAIEPKAEISKLFALFISDKEYLPVAPATDIMILLPGFYAPV